MRILSRNEKNERSAYKNTDLSFYTSSDTLLIYVTLSTTNACGAGVQYSAHLASERRGAATPTSWRGEGRDPLSFMGNLFA
jgi:hypothetical protein